MAPLNLFLLLCKVKDTALKNVILDFGELIRRLQWFPQFGSLEVFPG